jgi:HK97 family phage prohead protease
MNNCPCFYDHNTWEVPLGHWENLRKENNQLLGDLVIEGSSEREKQYITKIQNGDIKGASVGIDQLKWNDEPNATLLSGQTRPTLLSCELFEASITPLPGNTAALALKHEGSLITLNANNSQTISPQFKTENMKQIALKLGLSETATENEIINAIASLQLSKQTAEAFQTAMLKDADKDLTDDHKEVFVELSKNNPAQALKFAQANKPAAVVEPAKVIKDKKVSEMLQRNGGGENAKDGKDCLDYLQKHNPVELRRIHAEEPDKYAALAKEYQEGVRYIAK